MNFRISTLAFILLMASAAMSQDPPKAVLVDEFGFFLSCEDIISRTDVFFANLSQHPHDLGYAVLYPGGKNPTRIKRIVSANVHMRRFDPSRIRIVIASDPVGETAARFWRVPPGADPPNFVEIGEAPRDLSKAFLVGSDFTDNVCPIFIPDDFVGLIKGEPGSSAKIVIAASTWRERKQQAETDLKLLTSLGLAKRRVKFYFVHRPNAGFVEVNYWFVRARRTR